MFRPRVFEAVWEETLRRFGSCTSMFGTFWLSCWIKHHRDGCPKVFFERHHIERPVILKFARTHCTNCTLGGPKNNFPSLERRLTSSLGKGLIISRLSPVVRGNDSHKGRKWSVFPGFSILLQPCVSMTGVAAFCSSPNVWSNLVSRRFDDWRCTKIPSEPSNGITSSLFEQNPNQALKFLHS